jgi:hypothetical protein
MCSQMPSKKETETETKSGPEIARENVPRTCASWVGMFVNSFQPAHSKSFAFFDAFTLTRPGMPWVWADKIRIVMHPDCGVDREEFLDEVKSEVRDVSKRYHAGDTGDAGPWGDVDRETMTLSLRNDAFHKLA